VERLVESAFLAELREMDIDSDPGSIGGSEEGEALHVIHVEMAHEEVEFGDALPLERATKFTDAGASIENQDTRSAADLDAGRVAATP